MLTLGETEFRAARREVRRGRPRRPHLLGRHGRGGGPRHHQSHGPGRARALAPRRGPHHQRPAPQEGDQAAAPHRGVPPLRHASRVDDPLGPAGHPAGPATDGPAGRRPLRDVGPQRPLPPRHQPQQPAEAAPRAGCARDHHPQREADAPGGVRRPDRQRPPRPRDRRHRQPSPEVPERHAQGQAGPVPPEPARQARGLLRPVGHRRRPGAQAPPVRPAQEDGARAVQAVRDAPARREGLRAQHQERQAHRRARPAGSLGRSRRGHQGPPGPAEPRPDAPPPGHPGVHAGPRRGLGDPDPPARLHRVQRGLRRRPDGGPRAAVRGRPGGSEADDAVDGQPALARRRVARRGADAGHGPRLLLPDPRARTGRAGKARRRFATEDEAILAYQLREQTGATLHEPVRRRGPGLGRRSAGAASGRGPRRRSAGSSSTRCSRLQLRFKNDDDEALRAQGARRRLLPARSGPRRRRTSSTASRASASSSRPAAA